MTRRGDAVQPLPYALPAEQFGIVSGTGDDGVTRITVPGIRSLGARVGGAVGFAVIFVCTVINPVAANWWVLRTQGLWGLGKATAVPILIGAVLLTLLVRGMIQMRSAGFFFEITSERFCASGPIVDWEHWQRPWMGNPAPRKIDVPRSAVTDVRGHNFGMGLTIRVEGVELFEMMHEYPQHIRVAVAGLLREALGMGPDPTLPK